jgi:hypothetical protein
MNVVSGAPDKKKPASGKWIAKKGEKTAPSGKKFSKKR